MIGRPPLDKNTDLLQEIETLSRALSLHTSSKPKLKSTPSSSSSSQRKKPSLWNWNPLKALSRIRQRRFDCIFSLHVHSIENLPSALSDAALSVHWKRASSDSSSAAGTSSVYALDGVVEFEEKLNYRCSVYGTRKGSRDSAAKYEARQFLIYVLVSDAPEVEDLGKHVVDVTRLLPLTLEELEDRENRAGKWSTSFRLSGKGKGALLNVSLGFLLIDDGTVPDALNLKMHDERLVGRGTDKGRLRWARARSQSVEDVRVLHEILPSLKSSASSSLGDTVEKLEIRNFEFDDLCVDEMFKPRSQALAEHFEGRSVKEPVFENIDVEGLDQGNQVVAEVVVESFDDCSEYKESRLLCDDNQATMDDQDLVCGVLSLCEREGLETLNPEFMTPFTKSNHTGVKSEYEEGSVQNNSFGFDDSIEAIASEFFDMLGIDHDPFGLSSDNEVESPREQLWRKFEEENLGAGSLLFGLDIETELYDEPINEHNLLHEFEDFDSSFMVHEAERELYEATQGLCHYSRSELLDIAETEALMRQWGLNEKEFQCSPPGSTNGFDSPIDLSSELPLKLPPLGDGVGPFVQTKDGGFLRSMRPALFRTSKCNASLMMQVSSPIVVPAEMGILHRLASVGIKKPSTLAKNLMMPFEDVTGKTMQQIAWEVTSALDTCKSPDELPDLNREVDVVIPQKASGRRRKETILNLASSSASDRDSKCVLDKIEALPMEALRIQSGMSDLGPQFFGNMPVSGIVIDGDQTSDRTSKFLVAHQVAPSNLITGGWKQEKTGGKRSGRSWGLLPSNFTVALMVHFRDTLRNYDPVGTPMLIFLTAKPRIHATVSEKGNSEEDETELKPMTKSELILVNGEKKAEEEGIPQLEITEVHVAGHATEANRKNVWDNSVQHQSGLRWLIANGMGKSNKYPFMKSKLVSNPGDALWSISSQVHGTETKWKEMLAMHAHFQNPSNGFRRRR